MLNSKRELPSDERFLLSTLRPSRAQIRFAVWVMATLLLAMLAAAPFSRVPLAHAEILLPAYATAVLFTDLITAVLLFAVFSVQCSRAILTLAVGYLFVGLMVIPWVLTFPGAFAPSGLLGAGLQTTASIAAVRRVGFPLVVLVYALLKDADRVTPDPHESARARIFWSALAVVIVTCGLTWLIVASEDILPRFMIDSMRVSALWQYVPASAAFLCLTALAILWMRCRSVLDVWLMVVLCTLLIEIILLAFLSSGRFSIGWWAGRFYGLAASSVVLFVLLSEVTTLYARLVLSAAAERRAREARLTTMEALSASIAHEVNQPLASMVTNADAGLRWLERANPEIEEARAALRRIVSSGHRAGQVIESIRTMFKKGAGERLPVNMNQLIDQVLTQNRSDINRLGVSVRTELSDKLPLVNGNLVQLQQVVSNLVANAIDAMSSVFDRSRVLCVRSAIHESGNVMISVEDSGIGLDREHKEQIFEPFFTTKGHGMGMGLMICRSIIEAHGGRMWFSDTGRQGAIFQFILPAINEVVS